MILTEHDPDTAAPGAACYGDARNLPIRSSSVDLVVTSPPYANAIDYMRAHKFSLVWMGYPIEELSILRGQYIGSERENGNGTRASLPSTIRSTTDTVSSSDRHKGRVLENYFKDMKQSISEDFRVLCSGGSLVLVVGPSTIRGMRINTHEHVAELIAARGFRLVDIAERTLDRDRRLMPVGAVTTGKGIEQRIHTEYVIGAVKP